MKTRANSAKPNPAQTMLNIAFYVHSSSLTPAIQSWVIMAPGMTDLLGQSWLLCYLDDIPMGNGQLQRICAANFVIWGSSTAPHCFAPWCHIVGWELDPGAPTPL